MAGIPRGTVNQNQTRVINPGVFRQFMLYSSAGAIGTAAHYLILIALVQFLGLSAVFASSVGFLGGAGVNYALNYHYIFRSKKNHHEAVIRFFTVAAVGFIFNGAIIQLITTELAFHYLIAQLIATGCVLIWTFLCNRFWTFG
jgi:putative flippase GtrA